jgi:hypothetical protein
MPSKVFSYVLHYVSEFIAFVSCFILLKRNLFPKRTTQYLYLVLVEGYKLHEQYQVRDIVLKP